MYCTAPYPTTIRRPRTRAFTLSVAAVTAPASRVDKAGPLIGKLAGAPTVLDLCAPPAVSRSSRALSVPYHIAMTYRRGRVGCPSSQAKADCMVPGVIVSLPQHTKACSRVAHVGRAHVFEARSCQIRKFTEFTQIASNWKERAEMTAREGRQAASLECMFGVRQVERRESKRGFYYEVHVAGARGAEKPRGGGVGTEGYAGASSLTRRGGVEGRCVRCGVRDEVLLGGEKDCATEPAGPVVGAVAVAVAPRCDGVGAGLRCEDDAASLSRAARGDVGSGERARRADGDAGGAGDVVACGCAGRCVRPTRRYASPSCAMGMWAAGTRSGGGGVAGVELCVKRRVWAGWRCAREARRDGGGASLFGGRAGVGCDEAGAVCGRRAAGARCGQRGACTARRDGPGPGFVLASCGCEGEGKRMRLRAPWCARGLRLRARFTAQDGGGGRGLEGPSSARQLHPEPVASRSAAEWVDGRDSSGAAAQQREWARDGGLGASRLAWTTRGERVLNSCAHLPISNFPIFYLFEINKDFKLRFGTASARASALENRRHVSMVAGSMMMDFRGYLSNEKIRSGKEREGRFGELGARKRLGWSTRLPIAVAGSRATVPVVIRLIWLLSRPIIARY
ncbi:hypothetical protein B0H17DRAFT_1145923 [Mycena rosella]|uniref:Uncharacterized protein n=1 Tax=Mycena rosella TaxID=1033263 RepID=A0AAD7CQS9_MYCRO|nr:hypothetical protein B0H17DRAFT_1145923 [Mycena rosella]